MRFFPTPYPNEPKVCSACSLAVPRKDCHKNRYGQYICKTCQAAGVKFTRAGRLRHGSRHALMWAWLGVGGVVMVVFLVWAVYSFLTDADFFGYFQSLFRD